MVAFRLITSIVPLLLLAHGARIKRTKALLGLDAASLTKQKAESGSTSAVELCGSADPATLEWFDDACPPTPPSNSSELTRKWSGLTVITTDQGQPGKYGLPTYRLYVCNPASSKRGFLFSQRGFEVIHSEEDMRGVMGLVMAGPDALWDMSADVFQETSRAWWKAKKRPPAMLWLLDKGGNLIIAPEVQEVIFKHGDLVPGETPISDPAIGTAPRKASCCCKSAKSCIYLPGTCPEGFQESPNSCNEAGTTEQKYAGNYRGLARGAGEIRYDDKDALVQDKSSFALQRVGLEQLSNEEGDFDQGMLEKIQTLGTFAKGSRNGECAMARVREYWQAPLKNGLGLADDDVPVKFAAVSWPEGKETMTPV